MRISDWSSDVCSSDLAYYSMRGFSVQPTMVNGLPGLTNGSLDPAGIERIDVIKGPSGTLFGSRSEERRVGKECVSTCRSRWLPYHSKQNKEEHNNISR